MEPFTLIEGPDAWYAKDYAVLEDHMLHLTEQHLAELDKAIEAVLSSGKPIQVGGSAVGSGVPGNLC